MLDVINPANEQVIQQVPQAGIAEADAAVARAKRAFATWKRVSPPERTRMLRRLAETVARHEDELVRLESLNTGKPLASARGEVGMAIETFRYYAGAGERLLGESIPVSGGIDITFREPLGVIGIIVPWNFPFNIASWNLAPALAAGNTVVLKPAELTPLTAVAFERIALEAGLPEGVVNVVVGKGSVVGRRLVEHPDVAKIAFTGSTEVGRDIMRRAADTIKQVTLELGGKSANVVFADADLDAAAAAAPGAAFDNAGQDCCSRSRILVEKSVFDQFMAKLEPAVKKVRVGDPTASDTTMGPLISAVQRDRVASYVPADAPVAFRGSAPSGSGYWYPPTVLAPVARTDRVATEEIFGPVVCVLPFDDEADAAALANATIYGLSGSIWTRDTGRAVRMARAIDSGVLSINSNTSVRVSTPFGGMKQSGTGRELGPHALEHYSQIKNVFIATGE